MILILTMSNKNGLTEAEIESFPPGVTQPKRLPLRDPALNTANASPIADLIKIANHRFGIEQPAFMLYKPILAFLVNIIP
jgi:hypothetical protein